MNNQLSVGRIIGLHGLDGALKIEVSPQYPGIIKVGEPIHIGQDKFDIVTIKGGENARIIELDGITDREAAGALLGCEIMVDRDLLGEPDADEWFIGDLEGCKVIDCASGAVVGEVKSVELYPANAVLTLDIDGKDVLAPFVEDAVVEVDLESCEIKVDLDFLGLVR